MASAVNEFHDIQGIVRFGYGKLEEASFLLLRIDQEHLAEAKAWLAAAAGEKSAEDLSYRVTTAVESDPHPERALQIAFTEQGLQKLGVPLDFFPEDKIKGPASERIHVFSREFYLGMTGEYAKTQGRSRRLGDTGENDPAKWDWGRPEKKTLVELAQPQKEECRPEGIPDVLLMLYAERGGLNAFQQIVTADIALGFEIIRVLRAADATISEEEKQIRHEPFGFRDGISQPKIDWDGERRQGSRDDLEYGNLIAAGEFLLGYQNEYGQYTRRPLIDPKFDPQNILAPATDNPEKRDFGRNGTYLVFRHLEQNVHAFWKFAHKHSPGDGGVGMAEAMVGRRLSTGDPLVPASLDAIRGVGPKEDDIRQNGFTFDADPDGLACPFGAHIRRANPRNADMPGGRRQSFVAWLLRILGLKRGGPRDDLLSASRLHRIIRRGRPFGAIIDPETALKEPNPGFKSGIYFIALNANISRQFEFIQSAWIVSAKFNGLDRESDPLLGNRQPSPLGYPKQLRPLGYPTDEFTLPQPSGPNRRICGLPQFVTVRGGAYFFLPSIGALRYIARLGGKV
ncbi:MAG: peroxidase [Beijerinckiaceae bacterium]|nr:peroxidase [Beijerinckiaceae bacterium]